MLNKQLHSPNFVLITYKAHPKLEVPFVVVIALIFPEALEDVVQLSFQVVAACGIKGYAPARAET